MDFSDEHKGHVWTAGDVRTTVFPRVFVDHTWDLGVFHMDHVDLDPFVLPREPTNITERSQRESFIYFQSSHWF